MKKRLLEIASYFAVSVRRFEEECGLKRGNISNMTEDSSIGSDKLSKIIDKYPSINLEWLITGNGDMLKSKTKQKDNISYKIEDELKVIREESIKYKRIPGKETIETRPRIPYDAAAGSLSVALSGISVDQCEQVPVIRSLSKYDYSIYAKGESMVPEFQSGDELFCLSVSGTQFIQWGKIHVLDTAQGIIVKRIYDEDNAIICHSEFNEKYREFRIPKEEVYGIGLVIGIIRRY